MLLLVAVVSVCCAQQLRLASVLGAQIFDKQGETLAEHTKMRVVAAHVLYQQRLAASLLLSGGSNVGVRYWMNGTLMSNADFRFVTFARARDAGPSEARAMGDYLTEELGMPPSAYLLDEMSATTEENGVVTRMLLRRTNFLGNQSQAGVVTNLYHMSRALSDMAKTTARPGDVPLCAVFAEDFAVLSRRSRFWRDQIMRYYSVKRSGLLVDSKQLLAILNARIAGDTTQTVGSLVNVPSCQFAAPARRWRTAAFDLGDAQSY